MKEKFWTVNNLQSVFTRDISKDELDIYHEFESLYGKVDYKVVSFLRLYNSIMFHMGYGYIRNDVERILYSASFNRPALLSFLDFRFITDDNNEDIFSNKISMALLYLEFNDEIKVYHPYYESIFFTSDHDKSSKIIRSYNNEEIEEMLEITGLSQINKENHSELLKSLTA